MSEYGDEYGTLYGSYRSTRSSELLASSLSWLSEDGVIDYLLDEDGDVVPVAIAKETKADPRISVGVSTTSSERQNFREAKEFEVRVIVDATKQWVEGEEGSILELTQLKDRVGDVLTEHRDDWGALGIQADEEIQPDDDVNRYLGVCSFGFERDDPHKS